MPRRRAASSRSRRTRCDRGEQQQTEPAGQHLQGDEHERRVRRGGIAVINGTERPGQAAEQDQELPAEAGDAEAALRRDDHQHAHETHHQAELLGAAERALARAESAEPGDPQRGRRVQERCGVRLHGLHRDHVAGIAEEHCEERHQQDMADLGSRQHGRPVAPGGECREQDSGDREPEARGDQRRLVSDHDLGRDEARAPDQVDDREGATATWLRCACGSLMRRKRSLTGAWALAGLRRGASTSRPRRARRGRPTVRVASTRRPRAHRRPRSARSGSRSARRRWPRRR